jgi:hypothetical protein
MLAIASSTVLTIVPFTHPGRKTSAGGRHRARDQGNQRLRQLAATDEDQLQRMVAADEAEALSSPSLDVIEHGDGEFRDDCTALEAICSAVPVEMVAPLATKETAKDASIAYGRRRRRTFVLSTRRSRSGTASRLKTLRCT